MNSGDCIQGTRKETKCKAILVKTGLLLVLFLCFISPLSIAQIYAQPTHNNKIAIVFDQLHVYESHSWIGCANWDVFGSLEHEFSHREIVQLILKGCLNEDNTYRTLPTTAIVEELPDNEPLLLWVWVLNRNWIGSDLLSYFNLDVSNPPPFRTPQTIETADYNISFELYNCGSFPHSQDIKFICNYPPGQYYRFEGNQVAWQRGYPLAPDDLEGCGWPFC
jgi:hypothetical protein